MQVEAAAAVHQEPAAIAPKGRSYTTYLLYGALSVAFCWPLFDQPLGLGTNDWDQHFFYYGSVLKSAVEYLQPPFWNPWYCGGNVLWQNPQIALLSPVYPLTAIAPIQLAMKLNIVLHYWIGFIGMHLLLTRVIGLRSLPVVIYLATLVTASGAPAIHFRVGHSNFLPGFYLPLQLYFLFRAHETRAWRDVFLAAATLALMVFNGGPHILPMSFAAIGAFSLAAAILKRDWRPLAVTAGFVAIGLAYSAPKLLPVSLFATGERFWDTRNPTGHPDLITPEILYQTYLVPTQDVGERLPMQRHGWHEYGNYIGIPGVVATTCGIVWALLRRRAVDRWFGWSLVVASIMVFLLSLGEFHSLAPATLSTYLPLFSSFRIPSRYTIPFVQFGTLAAAWACASVVNDGIRRQWIRNAVGLICIGATAHLILVNRENLTRVFSQPSFDTSFHVGARPRQTAVDADSSAYAAGSPMFRALIENRSFFYCYESLQSFRTAIPTSPFVLADGDGDRVFGVTFSPNRLDFTVNEGSEPTRVILNTNWNEGWTSTAGPVDPGSRDALASVTVPPGPTRRFSFSFVPPGLIAGTLILAAALALSALAWRKRIP